jgi:ATP-binding cassette subfamily B protein
MPFKFYKQLNAMDCGPTCLKMIANHYGKHYSSESLRKSSGFSRGGVSMRGLNECAQNLGFRTRAGRLSYQVLEEAPLPTILHWDQNHFVVLMSIDDKKCKVADPSIGIITFKKDEFIQHWIASKNSNDEDTGLVLLLEPAPSFYEMLGEKGKKLSWELAFRYLRHTNGHLFQIFVALAINFGLGLIFPFLTRSVVDIGINTKNLNYITMVLIAQLVLVFGASMIGFISSRLQLRMSNMINISILSDFWIKLTSLPVSYFDNHRTGDTLQRLGDNRLIQSYITNIALNTIFSVINFLVYSVILMIFSMQLFLIFVVGNLLYIGWVRLFLGIRRRLNYESFHLATKENNATLQLVQGMQEIKLNNAEHRKRWEWENMQARLFKLSFKGMKYGQLQSLGGLFINQGKDIFISFIVARYVVDGQLTFGSMLAIQYIIGQLHGPVGDFIGLIQGTQDAKISLERLNEIHELEDEEPAKTDFIKELPADKTIRFQNVRFSYPGARDPVLEDINLVIPAGQVTAIVGVSGSGKTTLLKLLMKVYADFEGTVKVGPSNFKQISPSFWRGNSGAVMQDGYIFNDSIARNVSVSDDEVDVDRLLFSCEMANITSFIATLPNGINTQLGSDGVGISQGQKQRLLIARAVYKDPEYLFFDEATNALDANNEKVIVENLASFFVDRTVVVVAHRLSTVRHADKIVLLKGGKIVEEGSHNDLICLKGHYYELVKNQLELGD